VVRLGEVRDDGLFEIVYSTDQAVPPMEINLLKKPRALVVTGNQIRQGGTR